MPPVLLHILLITKCAFDSASVVHFTKSMICLLVLDVYGFPLDLKARTKCFRCHQLFAAIRLI
jgi:hypothetical protein